MNDKKKTDKKMLLIRILVPVLIVVALVAIWVVKTDPFSSTTPTKEPTSAPSRTQNPTDDSTTVSEETEPVEDFVLEATSIDLDALKGYNLPIIIDFGADYCAPCREMAPVLVIMNEEMQGKAIIKFVDIEKSDAANDFPVSVIPTQFFISADGTPYVPSDELVEDLGIVFDSYYFKDTGELAFTVHQGGLTEDEMRAILVDMGVT